MARHRAIISDDPREGRRILRVQEVADFGDDKTILRVALTGRGTWKEIDSHLASLGLAAKGWRQMNYDIRSMLTEI